MNRTDREPTPARRDGHRNLHPWRLRSRPFADPLGEGDRVRFRIDQGGTPGGRAVHPDRGNSLSRIQELCDLHDQAGDMQRRLLEGYPGTLTLPTPLRQDLEYYDGAQFYMLHISRTLEAEKRTSILTPDQHIWLVSTNGLNDWWMDESNRGPDGRRNYRTVIEAFDGINEVCYSYLHPERERTPRTVRDPEVQHVTDYYQYVLEQMPEEQRPSIARQLIAINLYQGLSLYQEQGFRGHMGFGEGELEYNEDNRHLLDRMRIEKGGIIFTYFWPYFPEIADGITIPDEPPTIGATIQSFLDGSSFYPTSGVGRRLLEIGGMNQRMDDSCDRELDRGRGVVSPENWGTAYAERHDESRDDIVIRILNDLDGLRSFDDDGDHKLVVDAGVEAVGGLTLFRANRSMSRKERAKTKK